MKTSELRTKDIAALEKEVSDLLKAHFGLRMQKATQQLTNHTQLGNTRRDVARVKTIIAEKKRVSKQGPPNERHPDSGRSLPPLSRTRARWWAGGQRQAVQDGHRAGRAPHRARALRQDRRQVEQVPRPR
jgi:large subunit ribosomal protein L29